MKAKKCLKQIRKIEEKLKCSSFSLNEMEELAVELHVISLSLGEIVERLNYLTHPACFEEEYFID